MWGHYKKNEYIKEKKIDSSTMAVSLLALDNQNDYSELIVYHSNFYLYYCLEWLSKYLSSDPWGTPQ